METKKFENIEAFFQAEKKLSAECTSLPTNMDGRERILRCVVDLVYYK